MQVRIFSAVIQSGTDADAFELEINNWLNEEDIEILSMTVSSSERDGDISMVFFVVYDEPEDEDEDDEELTVTIPRIQVRELSHLIPRLR